MQIKKVKNKKESMVLVHLSEDEALKLIEGLISQLKARNSNANRAEFLDGNDYFSVFVDFQPELSANDKQVLLMMLSGFDVLLEHPDKGGELKNFLSGHMLHKIANVKAKLGATL